MNLGRVAGIPLRVHSSFFLVLALYSALAFAAGGLAAIPLTLATMGALFASVVLHELGHALTGRRFGVSTAHITLYPFGGIAAMQGNMPSPKAELLVALAGPLVNFVLAAFGVGAALTTGAAPIWWFALMNLTMGVFNLLPAFPMDGGRVLRAALVSPLGYFRASDVAIRIGRGFAWLFLLGGVASFTPSLVIVGLFLVFAGRRERAVLTEQQRTAKRRPKWRQVPVRWVLNPPTASAQILHD